MLRFYKGRPARQGRIGIFPGTFNPPTNAHIELGRAAQEQHRLDQVVAVLPEKFPHKDYSDASFEHRLAMLRDAAEGYPSLAIASLDWGLFIDIARAFRAECGQQADLYLICGRDAAERIVNWDYAEGPSFGEQLQEFELLVGSRQGDYKIPPEYQGRIHLIDMPRSFDEVSASRVREAIREGRRWRHWLPKRVADRIERERLYLP